MLKISVFLLRENPSLLLRKWKDFWISPRVAIPNYDGWLLFSSAFSIFCSKSTLRIWTWIWMALETKLLCPRIGLDTVDWWIKVETFAAFRSAPHQILEVCSENRNPVQSVDFQCEFSLNDFSTDLNAIPNIPSRSCSIHSANLIPSNFPLTSTYQRKYCQSEYLWISYFHFLNNFIEKYP